LVDLRGTDANQTFAISTPLLTGHDAGMGHGNCSIGHPRSSPPTAAVVVVGLKQEDELGKVQIKQWVY